MAPRELKLSNIFLITRAGCNALKWFLVLCKCIKTISYLTVHVKTWEVKNIHGPKLRLAYIYSSQLMCPCNMWMCMLRYWNVWQRAEVKQLLKAQAKRSQHINATYRNIVGRNLLRAFWPHGCDVLRHGGCCWLKFEDGQIWVNNIQHGATGWPNARNNVAICCVDMLRSLVRDLSL